MWPRALRALGLVVLIAADLVLASSNHWSVVLGGVVLWGLHMGMTQGLLAAMVAEPQTIPQAFSLITLLKGLDVPELTQPDLTANWETQLARMEKGEISREKFMAEIVAMTEHIVGQAKNFEHDTIPGDFGAIGVACPKCGGEVHENYKKFQCQKCDFALWKILGGRQLETAHDPEGHSSRSSASIAVAVHASGKPVIGDRARGTAGTFVDHDHLRDRRDVVAEHGSSDPRPSPFGEDACVRGAFPCARIERLVPDVTAHPS